MAYNSTIPPANGMQARVVEESIKHCCPAGRKAKWRGTYGIRHSHYKPFHHIGTKVALLNWRKNIFKILNQARLLLKSKSINTFQQKSPSGGPVPLKDFTRVRCGLGTWLWASLARSRRGCRPYPANHRTFETGLPDPDPHYFWKLDQDTIRVKSWMRIRIGVKIQNGLRGSK